MNNDDVICYKCNKPLSADDKFCPYCGNEVSKRDNKANKIKKKEKKNKLLIMLTVANLICSIISISALSILLILGTSEYLRNNEKTVDGIWSCGSRGSGGIGYILIDNGAFKMYEFLVNQDGDIPKIEEEEEAEGKISNGYLISEEDEAHKERVRVTGDLLMLYGKGYNYPYVILHRVN